MKKYDGENKLCSRQLEMLNIVIEYLENISGGSKTIFYDDADCDRYCIAEDLKIAFFMERIE